MALDMKNEEEVKEYIENLGQEYRIGCYHEKRPEVCHLLGDFMEAINKNFEKASTIYKSTCNDFKYGKSCLKFGHYSFLAKGKAADKGDVAQAYQYYEKGCEYGDADSCMHSALLLTARNSPKGVERDVPKALKFLTKSCDMNNGTACFYLSGMHISGVTKSKELSDTDYVIPKDMAKAFQYAERACELRNHYACANLSQMYERGDGITKNVTLAAKYKKLALDMQDELKHQKPTLAFQQGLKG